MDAQVMALLTIVGILLGIWAVGCLGVMALAYLPVALYYVGIGLYYGVVWAGYGLLYGLLWVVRIVEAALEPWQRRRAVKREYKWAVARQRRAKEHVEALFADASQKMERVSGR